MSSDQDVYKPVNDKLWREAETHLQLKEDTNCDAHKFVEAFLERYNADGQGSLKYQSLHLESKKKLTYSGSTHRSTTKLKEMKLSKRQQRKLGLLQISKEEQKYSLYVPLHELWKDYVKELFKGSNKNCQVLAQKMLKADLHGCKIKVADSKCSSIIGQEGIIVQETQNTFRIATIDNRIKTIPKGRTVFTFQVSGHEFVLYGQNLLFRAADRSSRKFKDRPFIDI